MNAYKAIFCILICAHVSPAFASITIEKHQSGKVVTLYAKNRGYAPAHVHLRLTEQKNLHLDRRWPISITIPPSRTIEIGKISPNNPNGAYKYRYAWNSRRGNPEAEHDSEARYLLPFEDGTRFTIAQGYDARTTHDSAKSHYAVDFSVPPYTPVVAARAGLVTKVVSHFVHGAPDPSLRNKSNYVEILHADGSFANYAHLAPTTTTVVPGQRIRAGERLGLSGNTGYSYGPHLHFEVFTNTYQGYRGVPIIFLDGQPARPIAFFRKNQTGVVNYGTRYRGGPRRRPREHPRHPPDQGGNRRKCGHH